MIAFEKTKVSQLDLKKLMKYIGSIFNSWYFEAGDGGNPLSSWLLFLQDEPNNRYSSCIYVSSYSGLSCVAGCWTNNNDGTYRTISVAYSPVTKSSFTLSYRINWIKYESDILIEVKIQIYYDII